MEIQGGGGSQKPNFLKECIRLNWNFQRGGELKPKNLPWEGYGYFLEQHNDFFTPTTNNNNSVKLY